MLVWKKHKDGSIFARHGKDVYKITKREQRSRIFPSSLHYDHFLYRNDTLVFKVDALDNGKDLCKHVAQRMAKGAKPYYKKLAETIKKPKMKHLFIECMKELHLDFLPDYTDEKWHKPNYIQRPENKEDPYYYWYLWNKCRVMEIFAERRSILTPLAPLYPHLSINAPNTLKPKDIYKPPAQKELPEYKGPIPQRRPAFGMMRMIACSTRPAKRMVSAKYKDIREWAEAYRDQMAELRQYPKISCLRSAIDSYELKTGEEKELAKRKLLVIYAEEWEEEQAVSRAQYQKDLDKIEQDKKDAILRAKQGKPNLDRFGNKIGTAAALINAVIDAEPKTAKQIAKLSGVEIPHSHLALLVKKKLVKRLVKYVDGKKRIRFVEAAKWPPKIVKVKLKRAKKTARVKVALKKPKKSSRKFRS